MKLGFVATGKRTLKNGSSFDKYFTNPVEGNEVTLMPDGDVYDTLKLMKDIVSKTRSQTSAIAKKLKGSSLEQTCRNIWQFLYDYVQYKKDHPLREQLRTPARTWKDRKTGVDCDCYSIFISSVLTNLGIAHSYRMAGYDGEFQHVYVVVPKNGNAISDRGSYFAVDPVVNQFNFEAPFTKKHDQKMARVTLLNGFDGCNPKPEILRLRKFIDTQEVIDRGGVPTKEFLVQNGIPFAPAFDNENDRSIYVISTVTGLLNIPTVLSPQQAEEIKASAGQCVSPVEVKPTTAAIIPDDIITKGKKNWWVWLAIGAGAWLLLTGSDQNEVKSGLDGFGKGKKKKAYKAISI